MTWASAGGREQAAPAQQVVPQGTDKPLVGTESRQAGSWSTKQPAFPSVPAAAFELVALTEWQDDVYWGDCEEEGPNQATAEAFQEEVEEDEGSLQEAAEVREGGTLLVAVHSGRF